jgi:hypothetical protein
MVYYLLFVPGVEVGLIELLGSHGMAEELEFEHRLQLFKL